MALSLSVRRYLDEEYLSALSEAQEKQMPMEATLEHVRQHMKQAYREAAIMENAKLPAAQRRVLN